MPVVINGSTGISGVDGSAGTPAVQGSDTNTGVFFPAADTIAFSEGGTEVMRINSSGNVGIGTSSPSGRLNLAVGASTSCVLTFTANNTGSGAGDRGRLDFYSASNTGTAYQLGYLDFDRADGTGTSSYMAINTRVSGTVAERMRIDSSGNLAFNSGYGSVATAYGCRAWVNFNGTGVVAIRASGNVTAITDNGTGDYTVNLTNAMPDVNYCFTTASGQFAAANVPATLGINRDNLTVTTTAVRLYNITGAGALQDGANLYVAFFR